MPIRYSESDVEVHLGDRVEIKVWFKRRSGRIVYLPGFSPLTMSLNLMVCAGW